MNAQGHYCCVAAMFLPLCQDCATHGCSTLRSRGRAEKGRSSHLPPAAVVFKIRRDRQIPFWAHVGVQEHQLACEHVTRKLCNQYGQFTKDSWLLQSKWILGEYVYHLCKDLKFEKAMLTM